MDGPSASPGSHALAFLVRLAVSAAVLWLSVGWVSPGNPYKTFWRAVLVSVLLSVAYYVTLAKFLWVLVIPWLLYVFIWLAVVMGNYGLGFWHALLLALAQAFLSWVVAAIFGVRTLRSDPG
jgi:putative membrane protein